MKYCLTAIELNCMGQPQNKVRIWNFKVKVYKNIQSFMQNAVSNRKCLFCHQKLMKTLSNPDSFIYEFPSFKGFLVNTLSPVSYVEKLLIIQINYFGRPIILSILLNKMTLCDEFEVY